MIPFRKATRASRLAAGLPRGHLPLYPDAGHAFWFQAAARFLPAVERFLR